MLTLSCGRVKLGPRSITGLRARDLLAESTGLWVEAGPQAGWRGGKSGQEDEPIQHCQT